MCCEDGLGLDRSGADCPLGIVSVLHSGELWVVSDYWAKRKAEREAANKKRCAAMHNPGAWPYVARCIAQHGHGVTDHVDKNGLTWDGPVDDG